jgi:hypothetical protein
MAFCEEEGRQMDEVGRGGIGERSLFVLDVVDPDGVPATVPVPGPHFVCLLAWDACKATDTELVSLASRLLRAGCVYAVCWGPDCERVHDVFDIADMNWRPDGPWAMTTWHTDDPLAEALWFSLFVAWPDAAFEDSCGSVVGISIGVPAWAAEVRAAFAAPGEFSARHMGSA